jgi:hypothetical protein
VGHYRYYSSSVPGVDQGPDIIQPTLGTVLKEYDGEALSYVAKEEELVNRGLFVNKFAHAAPVSVKTEDVRSVMFRAHTEEFETQVSRVYEIDSISLPTQSDVLSSFRREVEENWSGYLEELETTTDMKELALSLLRNFSANGESIGVFSDVTVPDSIFDDSEVFSRYNTLAELTEAYSGNVRAARGRWVSESGLKIYDTIVAPEIEFVQSQAESQMSFGFFSPSPTEGGYESQEQLAAVLSALFTVRVPEYNTNIYAVPTEQVTFVNNSTAVIPVSDSEGYRHIGAFKYGRGLNIRPGGNLDRLSDQDPLQFADPEALDSYVQQILSGESTDEAGEALLQSLEGNPDTLDFIASLSPSDSDRTAALQNGLRNAVNFDPYGSNLPIENVARILTSLQSSDLIGCGCGIVTQELLLLGDHDDTAIRYREINESRYSAWQTSKEAKRRGDRVVKTDEDSDE